MPILKIYIKNIQNLLKFEKQKKTLIQCLYCPVQIIAIRGTPAPRNNSPYGENIFSSWSSHSTQTFELMGAEPVEHWYSEEVNHIYGKEPLTLKTGHFTQVVWRDSQELGVGLAKNR